MRRKRYQYSKNGIIEFSYLTYDDYMYIMDLRRIDYIASLNMENMSLESNREIENKSKKYNYNDEFLEILDKCERFVAVMKYYSIKYFDYKKPNDEQINRYISALSSIINAIENDRDFDSNEVLKEYLSFINWHWVRLNNLQEYETEKERIKVERYCNIIALKTCQFFSVQMSTITELTDFIRAITNILNASGIENIINNMDDNGDDINNFIETLVNDKCVCVAKVKRKNGVVEWYIAFSGFRDNKNVCDRYNLKSNEKMLDTLWRYILSHRIISKFKFSLSSLCKTDFLMESNNISSMHCAPTLLGAFKGYKKYKKSIIFPTYAKGGFKDRECLAKHYACCERKILPKIQNRKSIKNIHFYITYEPCDDCFKSLKTLASLHYSSYIIVTAQKKYSGKLHRSGC